MVPPPVVHGSYVIAADDSPVFNRLLAAILHALKVEADIVTKGYQAVRAFDQRAPDLVILDLQMPGFDGLETAKLLRARPQKKPMHLVALSAETSDETLAECILAGFDQVWPKITPPKELQQRIRDILSSSESLSGNN